MTIKKKLGLGIASAALGLSLIGGGTFAYFNDIETSENSFTAGTLDLALNPNPIHENVGNLKPGDTILRNFSLQNSGSLDIQSVLLKTAYTVTDANGDNGNVDFGDHVRVNFLQNEGHPEWWLDDDSYTVVASKTLKELSTMNPDDLAVELEDVLWWDYEQDGIPSGGSDNLTIQYEFVDNNADQNIFQGDSLNLTFEFEAEQEAGEAK